MSFGIPVRNGLGVGLLASTSLSTRNRVFTPASLFAAGEQGGWYDPSDITTLFQDTAGTVPVTATGQTVARINDKSGRGNNLTQANAAARPLYTTDAGGRPLLRFDGTDDFLAGTMPVAQMGGNLSKTMFWAGRHTTTIAFDNRTKASYGTAGGVFSLIQSTDRLFAQWSSDVTQAGAATTNREVWAAIKNVNELSLNVNGVQVIPPTTRPAVNIVSNVFEIGRFITGSFMNGDCYGLIFVAGLPSVSAPTAWLAEKAGVVL